jgi:hypothetical protein
LRFETVAQVARADKRSSAMLSTVLIVVLLLLLIGALPTRPYSSQWGYGPGGIVGALLAIVLVMALIGRL